MFRPRRLCASVAVLVGVLVGVPRAAAADDACDGGALCSDEDRDGFVACGCPFAGSPCDCNDSDPTTFPGGPEACDGPKDLDCSGVVADPCPAGRGCLGSVCVPKCKPNDDFGCAIGSTFSPTPDGGCLCAPKDCTLFGCPPGTTCDESKACVPNCHPGVRCPHGQRCRGFGCVDPCAEVTCPDGGTCTGGLCAPSCACCPPGETCDPAAGARGAKCIETACASVQCAGGTHCERGACIGDCDGVVCPTMRVCRLVSVNGAPARGTCVDLCTPSPCKPGNACDWRTGRCTPLPTADGGLTTDALDEDTLEVAGAGWVCSARGLVRASAFATVASLCALAVFVVRRRKRSR